MFNLDPKTKKWLRLTGKFLLITVVVGIAIWLLVISPYLTHSEKGRYENAAARLRYFADDLKEGTRVPSETNEIRECRYASAKFVKGARSCSVGFSLLFENMDHIKANELMTDIEQKIGVGLLDRVRRGGELQDAFIALSDQPLEQRFGATFSIDGCEQCSVTLTFPNEGKANHDFSGHPRESIIVRLSYNDSARAEHYPVKD